MTNRVSPTVPPTIEINEEAGLREYAVEENIN